MSKKPCGVESPKKRDPNSRGISISDLEGLDPGERAEQEGRGILDEADTPGKKEHVRVDP